VFLKSYIFTFEFGKEGKTIFLFRRRDNFFEQLYSATISLDTLDALKWHIIYGVIFYKLGKFSSDFQKTSVPCYINFSLIKSKRKSK
jgi:hypothetical protein